MPSPRCLVLILAGVCLCACPGVVDELPDLGAPAPDMPVGDSLVAGGGDALVVPMQEAGADLGGPWDSGPAPDLPPPDLPPPDSAGPGADQGPPTGGKCPCASGLYCVNSACYAPCKAPTDPCKVVSNCPAAEACVETNLSGLWVCIPGNAPGTSCSSNYFCAQQHICAGVGSSGLLCLPICSAQGASCGKSGGKCIKASNSPCLFCSGA